MPTTAQPAQPARPGENAAEPVARRKAPARADTHFPIVGLGASAGGLYALSRFLDHAGSASGAAYVVIQHQDPEHPGILVELLQRHTVMPVTLIRNRTRARPNHVYVMPAGKDLSILHGTLHLLTPTTRCALLLPIDYFFRALAADCQQYAVGVILSGMGSDGTLGLRAIKENAGLTLVQEPTSATYAGMPQSAVDAGLADIVAAPDELPARITVYFRDAAHGGAEPAALSRHKPQSALDTIVILLREHTGNDFSLYKKSTLYRRIEHRMALHQVATIADYANFLRDNGDELDSLFDEFLIGVTSFFRDPDAWTALIETALPTLIATQTPGRALRAWVPACSTGEEAYSLAIAFREVLARFQPAGHYALQIFATDLDAAAVAQARTGFYPANIAADVTPERLTAWFVEENTGYRVKPEIRDMVIFAQHNLILDPPLTRLDILSCRNLLIYLARDLQDMLLPQFHHALNYHGILMLGSAESVGRFTHLFSALDHQQRLYRRIESALPATRAAFPQMPNFVPAAAPASCPPPPVDASSLSCPHLLALIEAAQASQEALRSAHEELQSTNEELTTAKEEMQSLSEELQTINLELQTKMAALAAISSDMENLLNNAESASLFLDATFNIRRFTPNIASLFKLLPVDLGRPLSHIASTLDYPGLLYDAGAVLRTLIPSEQTVSAHDGRHIRVRIMPYSNLEHIIDGVVITFTDVSESQAWRTALEEARQRLQNGLAALAGQPERNPPLERLLHEVQLVLQAHVPAPRTQGGARDAQAMKARAAPTAHTQGSRGSRGDEQ